MIGKLVELFLFYLTFVDNDGIVEVSTLDKVGLEQWHDVSYENECACRRNLFNVFLHSVECSKLAVDEFAFEGTHGSDTEIFVWQDGDDGTIIIFHFYFVADDVEIFFCILFLDSNTLDFLYIQCSRAIENRELRTIYLNQTVVNTECIKS